MRPDEVIYHSRVVPVHRLNHVSSVESGNPGRIKITSAASIFCLEDFRILSYTHLLHLPATPNRRTFME